MPGTLLLRPDASAQVGLGHASRCLAIAEAWTGLGGHALVLTGPDAAGLAPRARAAGVELRTDAPAAAASDLRAVTELAGTLRPDWLLLDGAFDAPFVQAARAAVPRVARFAESGRYDPASLGLVDAVINPNADAADDDCITLPPSAVRCLGVRYAPLRPEARALRGDGLEPAVHGTLLAFGGSDPDGASELVVAQLGRWGGLAPVTLVVGPANARRATLQAAATDRLRVLVAPEHPYRWWNAGAVALVAAGVTMLELLCVGMPCLVYARHAAQRREVEALVAAGAVAGVVDRGELASGAALERLDALLSDGAARARLGRRARELVDGLGAERVARRLAGEAA